MGRGTWNLMKSGLCIALTMISLLGSLLRGQTSERVPSTKGQADQRVSSHLEQAEKLAQTKQYSQAIPEYKLAIQEDPQNETAFFGLALAQSQAGQNEDRKSTRLNSSHGYISYAVFCLKKKKK